MNRLTLSLAALLAIAGIGSGLAADLPTKTPLRALVPTCGAGLYFGINTMGSAGVVKDSPVPGASIVQAELGATVGYTSTVGNCVANVASPFWFVEGRFDWTNLNGSTNGLSLTGPAHFTQRLGYGTPAITTILASIPGLGGLSTPSLPTLPTGVTATTTIPYLYVAANEQDVSAQFINPNTGAVFGTNRIWEVSPELGMGMWTRLSNNVVVDVNVGYQIQTGGVCIGLPNGACPGLGNMWRAGVSFNF